MSNKPKQTAKSKQRTEERVRLRVICLKPPQAKRYQAVFGLQDNSSTAYWVIHAGQDQTNGDIQFECECRVRANPRTGAPSFLGPFVHGDSAQRFLYLSWRPKDWRPGHPDPPSPGWIRRIKVHLSTITWAQIDEAVRMDGMLEAIVPGTSSDGGPTCASVPLVAGGWRIRRT
jgi:hypothetical protein